MTEHVCWKPDGAVVLWAVSPTDGRVVCYQGK